MTVRSTIGTLTSATSSVTLGLSGENTLGVVLIYGTYTGVTVNFTGSNDGTNWFNVPVVYSNTLLPVNNSSLVLVSNQNVAFYFVPGTIQRFKVAASGYTSGTANVEIYEATAEQLPKFGEQAYANAVQNAGMATYPLAAGTGSTNVQVATGAGVLQGYVTTTAGGTGTSISFYDSATTSISGLNPIYTSAQAEALGTIISLGIPFTNGLVAAAVNTSEAATISYTLY